MIQTLQLPALVSDFEKFTPIITIIAQIIFLSAGLVLLKEMVSDFKVALAEVRKDQISMDKRLVAVEVTCAMRHLHEETN